MSWLSPSVIKSVNYENELNVFNNFFKKRFPFVIDVSGYSLETGPGRSSLVFDIYVSATHFCELMDGRIERKVVDRMREISSQFVRVVIPELYNNVTTFNIRFFPEIEDATILKSLEEVKEEF